MWMEESNCLIASPSASAGQRCESLCGKENFLVSSGNAVETVMNEVRSTQVVWSGAARADECTRRARQDGRLGNGAEGGWAEWRYSGRKCSCSSSSANDLT